MTAVYINRISTAVPEHDIHGIFVTFAGRMLQDERVRSIFMRMAGKAEIAHRYSSLSTSETPGETAAGAFPALRGVCRFLRQQLRYSLAVHSTSLHCPARNAGRFAT